MSAGWNISSSFRTLYFCSCAQITAGSNVFGSFCAFCYKFREQVTTGANVWSFLAYHIIDFVQRLLRKQFLYFFSVFYHWFCALMTASAVLNSRVTASGSGMCSVLAFAFFFSFFFMYMLLWLIWRRSDCEKRLFTSRTLLHFIVDFARAAWLWEQMFYFISLFSIALAHQWLWRNIF